MRTLPRCLLVSLLGLSAPALAAPPEGVVTVPVRRLAAAPTVDGKTDDWGKVQWTRIKVQPADDAVPAKAVGEAQVELAAGIAGDRFFLAARWPDQAADANYRPWQLSGGKYKRSEERDDMFAVRFHVDGDYDRCMVAEKTYRVDVWVWSAGRSNASGVADDLTHTITTVPQDEAAEYKTTTGTTVYILKPRDAGRPSWSNLRAPKQPAEAELASVATEPNPEGSAADVAARGHWTGGTWTMEMARKLDTGNADDVVLAPGRKIQGAVAVFNKSHSENKSVSGALVFDFNMLK